MKAGRFMNGRRRVASIAVASLIGGLVIGCAEDGGLTADSTCEEYLAADNETRARAVRTIGVEEGIAGAGNPLAFANTDFNCGLSPSRSLVDAIASR